MRERVLAGAGVHRDHFIYPAYFLAVGWVIGLGVLIVNATYFVANRG